MPGNQTTHRAELDIAGGYKTCTYKYRQIFAAPIDKWEHMFYTCET